MNTEQNERKPPADVSFLELLVVLAKHKKLVLGLPIVSAVIAIVVSLLIPNVYTGTARILPPQGPSSVASALLGNLGPLSGLVGTSLGVKTPADLYAGMLQGHTIADALIEKFKLRGLYEKESLVETRRELAAVTTIAVGKDGIITVQVDDEDPKRAAEMANAYVEELDQLTQSVAVTEAARKRVFLEKQLENAKHRLSDAEVTLRKTMERTGLIRLEEQGRVVIESIAAIRAQIAGKEIQLASMKVALTENHPEYVRTRQELIGLRQELKKLEGDNAPALGSVIPPAGKVPESGLEYVRKLRDVKYYEALFEVLAKQYEIARSEEAADSGMIQIVDVAVPPDYKSKPSRALIVLLSTLLAGALGVAIALVLEAKDRAASDPDGAARLKLLEGYLKFRW